ncbi:MAG: hypothetical protein LBS83_00840 [Holosporales bacterium]|nr:hypothetical protein [Holosporales bacterium]
MCNSFQEYFLRFKILNISALYWGPQRMRILIAANPLNPKKFESAIFGVWV